MALREKLQALQDSLMALGEEEFFDNLELLEITHQAILTTSPLCPLEPEQEQSLNEQELFALDYFMGILHALGDCTRDLKPSLVRLQLSYLKMYVQNLIQSLKDADPAGSDAAHSETDHLEHILQILKLVSPGYRLNCLECLSEIIQELSPSKLVTLISILPASPTLHILSLLEKLAETDLLRPRISQQLLFLDDFS